MKEQVDFQEAERIHEYEMENWGKWKKKMRA